MSICPISINNFYNMAQNIDNFITNLSYNDVYSLEPLDFAKVMLLNNPQTYGPGFEIFFKNRYCAVSSTTKDSGDWEDNIEVKTSVVKDNKVNLVQIREWQPIDYYIFIIVEKHPHINITVLKIPAYEIYNLNLTSAHGSKTITEQTKHVEKRITLAFNGQIMTTFKNKYTYDKIQ